MPPLRDLELTTLGLSRSSTVIKTYICLFVHVCLTTKAVHLEVVSDLITEAFIAALRRFIARQGCPALIWSDHGSNFVGAKELQSLLTDHTTQGAVSDFAVHIYNIQWKFIPERVPHFGGIWEPGVKTHLKCVVSPGKLTLEEFSTVLNQIEACLNSCPLIHMNLPDDDGITVLTPDHFLISRPLVTLPNPQLSYRAISLLKCWPLFCQHLGRNFWERWQNEHLQTLNKYNKWRFPSKNVTVEDVSKRLVLSPPISRLIAVYPGLDKLVRVVAVKTPQGIYKRPVSKVAVLLPNGTDIN